MTPPLGLTAAAEGIHMGQSLDPGYPGYWTAECAEISGPVDVDRLCDAIAATVRDAEALHARFPDAATQIVDVDPAWRPEVVRLTESDGWERVRQLVDEQLSRAADLDRDPLFRSTVFVAADRVYWYIQAHHIVLDGFGYAMLYRQVSQRYRGQTPQPFGRFADLLADDDSYRTGDKAAQDREYWTSRLAGLTATGFTGETALPDRRTIRLSLPDDLLADVGASWPHRLLALVAAALHRRTGTTTPVLGLPVSGRLGTVAAKVPGMVMNIAPLPVPIALDHTVDDVTATVAATLKESRRHQRYRYEWLRGDLGLSAGQGWVFGPVVNVIPFAEPPEFPDCDVHMHHVSAGPVDDLAVTARGPRSLTLEANPQLYSTETLATIRDDLVRLAGDSARVSPWRVIDGPPPPETHPLPHLIDRHPASQPAIVDGDTTLTYGQLRTRARAVAADLFRRGVRPGELVAVSLPRGADAITAMLGVLYCGAGYLPLDPNGAADRNAAILAEASPAFTIDTDTPLPGHEPTSATSKAASRGPLGSASSPSRAATGEAASQGPLESADSPGRARSAADVAASHSPVWNPEAPAYVIYTSGSTGRPKGVAVPRSALDFFVASAAERYGFTADDRVLQFAPLHFDAHVEELFVSLAQGATIVVRDDSATVSLSRFADFLAANRVSVLDLPTAYWHELVQALHSKLVSLPDSVSTLIIGGEAASPERLAQWHNAVGDRVRLINSYGPTEATVVCLAADLSPGSAAAEPIASHHSAESSTASGSPRAQAETTPAEPHNAVSLGTPLPGVRVAIGPADELYIAGPGLASGYLADASDTASADATRIPDAEPEPLADKRSANAANTELQPSLNTTRDPGSKPEPLIAKSSADTAAAKPQPSLDAARGPHAKPERSATPAPAPVHIHPGDNAFISVDGERWYRTGDIVTITPNGQFAFHGRVDTELKISGHRVHPGEVEAALLRHPAVREAVVTVERVPRPRLVAHLAADTDVETLREHARRQLPEAAMPSSFHVRDRLPRTSTGKLDRRGLAEPVAAQSAEPATDAERAVLAVFAEVLGSRPAPDADFFASGGTSLTAIAAATRLSGAFEREVTAAELFAHPTATELAAVLSGQVAGVDDAALMDTDRVWHRDGVPCLPNGDDAIALTGATGFVGSHMLAALLADTDRPIRCLVRGDERRLVEAARRFGLPEPDLARVTVIDCDLSRPVLGLDAHAMSLVSDSQAIVNVAGNVSFTRGYSGLRAVNVEAVRTLLELACVGGSDFHQISTVSVGAGAALPEDFIDSRAALTDGYQRGKWVAEELVRQVGEQGLAVSCYRLGRVVPPASSSTFNPDDFVTHLIRASMALGRVPDLSVTEPWIAADVAAACVTDAVGKRDPRVWNLGGGTVSLTSVWQRLLDEHPDLEQVPVSRWRTLLADREDTAILKSFFDIHADGPPREHHIDGNQLDTWLADNGWGRRDAWNLDWCARVARASA
ncbi:AMP-binding protein [Stackebrandtia nassauensis]|uniref:Amino acid adenylation domain protein n=1 Tax=Stackebrandtia nassauensis (strain DSM 44728 / CIP 108903 / NRRL B-16338 / NBRC 102104 / LLR-40K-21) TaxID=446470 RepID=D3Q5B5_STANL|nr:AMP-binding protein [Stackebrandtia nassauensis]ADD44164.1 amino acid adenylation domain protein [Stackebrandtia nassauensis DSM 44728]